MDSITTSGFPFEEGKLARAASIGEDTLVVLIMKFIITYRRKYLGTRTLYPVGTEINVLFYDELLVGTGIGLFSHFNTGTEVSQKTILVFRSTLYCNRIIQTHLTQYKYFIRNTYTTQVKLEVFNLLGQKVAELVNQPLSAGIYNFNFDATGFSSGIYIYRLDTSSTSITKKCY